MSAYRVSVEAHGRNGSEDQHHEVALQQQLRHLAACAERQREMGVFVLKCYI